MTFLSFSSNEERRAYGGSYFIEIRYCRLPEGASDKDRVSVDSVGHWERTSLYVYGDDDVEFYETYSDILGDGLYNNMQEGSVDLCGINYYNSSRQREIIRRLREHTPQGHEPFLRWLLSDPHGNGFYVLGL